MVASALKVIFVPVFVDFPVLCQRGFRNASLIILLPGRFVAPDFQMQRLGEGVDAAHADAMQATGNFVGVRIELAARVQLRQHDLSGGYTFLGMNIDRNAAAVIDNR